MQYIFILLLEREIFESRILKNTRVKQKWILWTVTVFFNTEVKKGTLLVFFWP